jgi:AAA domain
MKLSGLERQSISDAIAAEIMESQKQGETVWLDIDAIKLVSKIPRGYIYLILLSKPVPLGAEQVLFFTLKSGTKFEATVVATTDEGITIVCSSLIPDGSVVHNVALDPSFILRGLEKFVMALDVDSSPFVKQILERRLEAPIRCQPVGIPLDLNTDQRLAIAQMSADRLHFLWGPPGTGKTTTLGAAIARWVRQGKKVLVASTSNAAVDVAFKAIQKHLKTSPEMLVRLQRLGKSEDPAIAPHCKDIPTSSAIVIACTLAKLVLAKDLQGMEFNVVIVDEASMVSMLYALAAASFAHQYLVFGGDFMQLPPICQSKSANADKWFGHSIYDWFNIGLDSDMSRLPLTMLKTQYRMTKQIGALVSHLCYRDLLVHHRSEKGAAVEFIDVPKRWQQTFYSVNESSYYHPFCVPIIHSVVESLAAGASKDFLLLTPFRPQQALMGALAFDLRERFPSHRFSSSTIHRSQGGERTVVILDLTAHASTDLVKFFQDRHSERLLNVGMSRARDHLIIIGNQQMLWTLAAKSPYWKRLLDRWDDITFSKAGDILDPPQSFADLATQLRAGHHKGIPSICSWSPDDGPLSDWSGLLGDVDSPRKLLVTQSASAVSGPFVVRQDDDSPSLFVGQGHICLPVEDGWHITVSPNVGRVIWRVGFSHLADEEVRPQAAEKAFRCRVCSAGTLVLKHYRGDVRLACNNYQFVCQFNIPLTLNDAKMKVRLANLTCSAGHPMIARQAGQGGDIFIGCENHPNCPEPTKSLKIIDGL